MSSRGDRLASARKITDDPTNATVFMVIREGAALYYLLKVIRRGFDVYCIPPHLGVHYSLHESGEPHFRHESTGENPVAQPSVILMDGEAGIPIGDGIVRAALTDLGRACGICSAMYPIGFLSDDFRRFNRSPQNRFVIDAAEFPAGTDWIEVGVWAVPTSNEVSFAFSVPDIAAPLLYKLADVEPQLWIYARPFA